VTGIVDGGTIDADVGGTVHRLGCIGIDTAEREQPCYARGKEATL
jgi:endonuclease YncB( thermonuclease family)